MSVTKGLAFFILAALFVSTFFFPFSRAARTNLVFGAINTITGPLLGAAIIQLLMPMLQGLPRLPISWQRNTIESYLACLLVADLAFYLSHRLSHEVLVFWRLHRFHHSAEEMDASVHYRHTVWSVLPNALLIAALAHLAHFHVSSVIFFFSLIGFYQIFLHSTFRKFPKVLSLVLLSPRAHHRHHDRADMKKNLGGMLTLWDRVFGTYAAPGTKDESEIMLAYGVDGWRSQNQIWEWMGVDILRAEQSHLLEPASPLSHPESPQDPAPSVPQPSPPAPATKIE